MRYKYWFDAIAYEKVYYRTGTDVDSIKSYIYKTSVICLKMIEYKRL